MPNEVRLNHAGVAAILKSAAAHAAVDKLAEQVADNARSQGRKVASGEDLPVEVTSYTTDRASASVTLAHPAGIAMQAKYGVLTRAAAEAGLEVKGGNA